MDEFNRFTFMLETLTELKPELDAQFIPSGLQPISATPTLDEVLLELWPLPEEAMFLGMASDGLPVLLNLHDPVPGPILITGDAGTGKTNLLQTMAIAVTLMHQPEQVQFGTLTSHPEEWNGMEELPNNVGIFSANHQVAEDFILSLASWAHGNKSSKQVVLLFIDDFEAITKMDIDTQQNLRWLLLRGPARRVWPIVTLNPNRMDNAISWLDAFHTRIYGSIQNIQLAREMNAHNAHLDSLTIGTQFAMREGKSWLHFAIPRIG